MPPLRPLLVIGTRPEAIKLAPVVRECLNRGKAASPIVCLTGQHPDLVEPVIDYFNLRADYRLDAMRAGQSLSALTARLLEGLEQVLADATPDCVVVQGDTTSVLAASLAVFYRRLPLVHVEAGLRTGDMQAPWPEEFNRRVAGLAAKLHCAPTMHAADNLLRAGVDAATVHVTGNTVIDALLQTVNRERGRASFWRARHAAWHGNPMVLITSHRRENQGHRLAGICRAVAVLAARFRDVAFVWPVHPNPHVQQIVRGMPTRHENIHLLPPADYPEFVWLMDQAALILTDSGGVQEEAPSLGKPVLVLRETTERPEAIECGTAELIGLDTAAIIERVSRFLSDESECHKRPTDNPFGDGQASRRIVDLMLANIGSLEVSNLRVA